MNKYDVIAIVIAGFVGTALITGLAMFAKIVSDFVDKTKGSD